LRIAAITAWAKLDVLALPPRSAVWVPALMAPATPCWRSCAVEVDEVMHDPHMHERGMLKWIEHDEIGRIVVPTTPLRIHGADPVKTVPSPKLGQHNREIYGDWLGLPTAEIVELEQDGII